MTTIHKNTYDRKKSGSEWLADINEWLIDQPDGVYSIVVDIEGDEITVITYEGRIEDVTYSIN
jgi:hypothetical protein